MAVRRLCRTLLLASLAAVSSPAFGQVQDDFGRLEPTFWCTCQMDEPPVTFLSEPGGGSFARITVTPANLGGNACTDAERAMCRSVAPPAVAMLLGEPASRPEMRESLGPSMISPPSMTAFAAPGNTGADLRRDRDGGYYCTEEVRRRGEAEDQEREAPCIQRQELRLQDRWMHPAGQARLYAFRFRMPEHIEDTANSVRWVTAQWKQTSIHGDYAKELGDEWSPSPFLAQRFDNGILHVTVQDEHCRCVVAAEPYLGSPEWADGPPALCLWTNPKDPARTSCTSGLTVEYGPDPYLRSPRGAWVTMRYRVQAGWPGPARIEIYDGWRLVATVTGRIGYRPDPGEENRIYFKIGHYRDYMPWPHSMDIDWVRIGPE